MKNWKNGLPFQVSYLHSAHQPERNTTDSFHLDPHLSLFQRLGRKEMNIASGCPMFIRTEHLLNRGFVKDAGVLFCLPIGCHCLLQLIDVTCMCASWGKW